MDYGFAPGRGALALLRSLLNRRANTTVVNSRNIQHLRAFVSHLTNNDEVARPIDGAILGSHANSKGDLISMPMFRGQAGATDFEVLVETISTAANSIAIPDAVIGYNDGDPITHEVNIKGCNIGRATPFLEKFKEALGNHVLVSAPKHFYEMSGVGTEGICQYLAYEWKVIHPSRFVNRAALVTAFEGAGHSFYEGTAVPAAFWNTQQSQLAAPNRPIAWQRNWIPAKIRRSRRWVRRAPLNPAIGRRRTLRTVQEFRVNDLTYRYTITYPRASDIPGTDAARQAAVRAQISALPEMQATHDFPIYERYGYADLNAFYAGMTWRYRTSRNVLIGTGKHYIYTVVVPICDLQTGDLLHHFYPGRRSEVAARTGVFRVNDPQFYGQV